MSVRIEIYCDETYGIRTVVSEQFLMEVWDGQANCHFIHPGCPVIDIKLEGISHEGFRNVTQNLVKGTPVYWDLTTLSGELTVEPPGLFSYWVAWWALDYVHVPEWVRELIYQQLAKKDPRNSYHVLTPIQFCHDTTEKYKQLSTPRSVMFLDPEMEREITASREPKMIYSGMRHMGAGIWQCGLGNKSVLAFPTVPDKSQEMTFWLSTARLQASVSKDRVVSVNRQVVLENTDGMTWGDVVWVNQLTGDNAVAFIRHNYPLVWKQMEGCCDVTELS